MSQAIRTPSSATEVARQLRPVLLKLNRELQASEPERPKLLVAGAGLLLLVRRQTRRTA
jgi:hypothetical protein